MGYANRTALPTCQYGVAANNEFMEADCGEPAVALWTWGNQKMYVCEKHDVVVMEAEDAALDEDGDEEGVSDPGVGA